MHSGVENDLALASEDRQEHSFVVARCKMEDPMVVYDVRHMLEQHSKDVKKEGMTADLMWVEREFDRRKVKQYFARKATVVVVLDPFYLLSEVQK
jgi:hypothetical protein